MGVSNKRPDFLKPERLRESDVLAVVSPAGRIEHNNGITKSGKIFQEWGIKVRLLKNVYNNDRYLAGSDRDRFKDLKTALEDSRYRGIICARGGFGSMRILRLLDTLRLESVKPFFGFSDITALHIFLNNKGWVTFHSPNLNGFYNLSERARRGFFRIVFGELKGLEYKGEYILRKGVVEGRLIGGNLSIISAMSGTEFDIDLRDKILLLEDVNEDLYRIDRMLTQLSLRPDVCSLKGVVFGKFRGCGRIKDLIYLFDEFVRRLKVPAIYGIDIGHIRDNLTIPLNIMYSLDASKCILVPLEEAFV